jgi:hypothetical protein
MPHAFPLLPLAAALAASFLLAPVPTIAGAAPVATFIAATSPDTRSGSQGLDQVVDCFARTARHPSFAHLARYEAHADYRLRIDGLMLETIRFTSTAFGGTVAEVRIAGQTAADRARFQKHRGAALDACLGAPVRMAAR